LKADPEFLARALLFKNLKGKKVKNDGSNSTGANLNDVPLDHHDELGDNDSRLDANDGPPDDSEPGDNNSQLTANESDEGEKFDLTTTDNGSDEDASDEY